MQNVKVKKNVSNNNFKLVKTLQYPGIHELDINKFLKSNDIVNEKTFKNYKTGLNKWKKFLNDNNIIDPGSEDVRNYRKFLQNSNLAITTQFQYLQVVKHYYNWANLEGISNNIAANIKLPRLRHDIHRKDALQPKDIKKIISNIDMNTVKGKRLHAIVLLCVVCGLRTIEINRANVEDLVKLEDNYYLRVQGKGHEEKDNIVNLPINVYTSINNYLKTRKHYQKKDALFVSTSNRSMNKRISTTTISIMIKTLLKQSGYDSSRITAHSLRHTSGTTAYNSNLSLYDIQNLMRHTNPGTSEIYIHASNQYEIEKKGREKIYNTLFMETNDNNITDIIMNKVKDLKLEDQIKVNNYINNLIERI